MLYSFLRLIAQVLFFLFGLKSEGLHNIAEKGPLILAANHVSYWDAIVVAAAVKRPINFMAKAELFDYPLLGYFVKKLNAFPVRRGIADRNAIKKALLVLEEEKVLGIFPEGMRNLKGEDLKAQAGVAMIALKSGAPVVPVACIGTNRILPLG
ncbi:MAG: lysophospholipid acyltransferase family protein, partial [Syntrophomonas sp.]|uniref:lysophospholipid acyltransferase family protein n=1 Tax=Syntrophomonas sp. TaxID=2053627 RepID=UPI00261D9202